MMLPAEVTKEEAPLLFLYVFLSTTALIMMFYFISLLIYHCVFWPKILAKIKADKPMQTAKQEQMLRELAVGRIREQEDKTQSERTETPVIERTQSQDEVFAPAHTVVSENASLIGDKSAQNSARSVKTCAATVTAVASRDAGLETAKEVRPQKARKWYEDDMMMTCVENQQPPPRTSESKDHKKRAKARRSDPTGVEEFLRTGKERKDGGKTIKRLRFAQHHDDMRTCVEKAPLLSQSFEDRKSDEQQQARRSEEVRKRRKAGKMIVSPVKDYLPRSVYAYEVDPKSKENKDNKDKEKGKEKKPKATMALSKSIDNSRDRPPDRPLLQECKTQED